MREPTHQLNADAIPSALCTVPQWVTWRLEPRDGRATKVPYTTDGRRASSTDPATWATFESVLARFQSDKTLAGIGFVLTSNDPFVGVDLDHVLDIEGAIVDWADEVVRKLDSYCEVTPSGRGLHIIARGILPPDGCRRGQVEMYAHSRYLTVTGQHVPGTPQTIEGRTAELAAVHAQHIARPRPLIVVPPVPSQPNDLDDRELLIRALRATSGHRFEALWSGDATAYGDDRSSADLALCNALAFWTGRDAGRMDRLFRASGLMRDKWDERHFSSGETYGQHTIAVAIASCANVYEPRSAA